MYKHLVFYDGECGLCDKTVQLVLKADKHQQFAFAPLQGETAKKLLKSLPPEQKNADSIVLIEDFQTQPRISIMSHAVFRIFWLLGGGWTLVGWLSFLPAFLFDWAYRIVARNRHRLFASDQCFVPPKQDRERFLP